LKAYRIFQSHPEDNVFSLRYGRHNRW
jgi:hypothetical protein